MSDSANAGESDAEEKEEDEQSDKQAKEAMSLDAKTTYEVVRLEGMRELERTTRALFWSGLAGGLSMGFSFLTQGILHAHLPEAGWRPLVVNAGYAMGFLIVILGSQQLYTENTLTPIVPLLHQWSGKRLRNVLRLSGVVLVANLLGAVAFALALAHLDVVKPEVVHSLSTLAREALEPPVASMFLHAIYAGWLIALMVWMLPASKTATPLTVIVMTYLVGLGGFAHVIAGSIEVLFATFRGDASIGGAIGGYILPALLGNTIGGVMLVAVLNHAQAQASE
jgi:formate/nitrite transporter FocA (FNT family)